MADQRQRRKRNKAPLARAGVLFALRRPMDEGIAHQTKFTCSELVTKILTRFLTGAAPSITTKRRRRLCAASSLIAAHRLQESPSTAVQKSNGAAVVEALQRGKPNKIMAYELKMRESTVKVHVRNIMKKLHTTNRTEVAYKTNLLLNANKGPEAT